MPGSGRASRFRASIHVEYFQRGWMSLFLRSIHKMDPKRGWAELLVDQANRRIWEQIEELK